MHTVPNIVSIPSIFALVIRNTDVPVTVVDQKPAVVIDSRFFIGQDHIPDFGIRDRGSVEVSAHEIFV